MNSPPSSMSGNRRHGGGAYSSPSTYKHSMSLLISTKGVAGHTLTKQCARSLVFWRRGRKSLLSCRLHRYEVRICSLWPQQRAHYGTASLPWDDFLGLQMGHMDVLRLETGPELLLPFRPPQESARARHLRSCCLVLRQLSRYRPRGPVDLVPWSNLLCLH
jgi:hypothetical protein